VEEVLLLNKFFLLSIYALVGKIWPEKVVRWCPDGNKGISNDIKFVNVTLAAPFLGR